MFKCQTAALDELFGNPEECFQRYQTAQILLHSLSQQVNHQQDRALLTKCKHCILLPSQHCDCIVQG
jgi:serine/threonine-protein kinase ULK/ATG1